MKEGVYFYYYFLPQPYPGFILFIQNNPIQTGAAFEAPHPNLISYD